MDAGIHICVLPEPGLRIWIVSLCEGPSGAHQELQRFKTREEAAEFAQAERERRRRETGLDVRLQLPDDCPCYRDGP